MLNAIFRPLIKWPGESTLYRVRSPFKSTYLRTLELLERELYQLGAGNIVIQVDARPQHFKGDQLRSVSLVSGPATIVSFNDGHEYAYPCDHFDSYPDNLRAIALALEALRKVDRYGVTRRGEQYQGFRALPPAPDQRPKMTPVEAAEFVASKVPGVDARALLLQKALFEVIFKLAQKALHPDAGGSHDEFVKLQQAGAVLAEHFKR
jgi:hypothetical protein